MLCSLLLGHIFGEEVPIENTADFINEYFINIGPKLATNMYIPWKFYDPISNKEIENFEI